MSPAAIASETATSANSWVESRMFLKGLRRMRVSFNFLAGMSGRRSGRLVGNLGRGQRSRDQVIGIEQDEHLLVDGRDALDEFIGGAGVHRRHGLDLVERQV